MYKVIDGIDLSGQKTLHGLTLEQFYALMKHQEFKCALSGFKFRYCDERKKYLDYQYPNGKKQIAPAIDHDHETGLIRGILSERVNQLTDQWHKWKAYGKLSEPKELILFRSDVFSDVSKNNIDNIENTEKKITYFEINPLFFDS